MKPRDFPEREMLPPRSYVREAVAAVMLLLVMGALGALMKSCRNWNRTEAAELAIAKSHTWALATSIAQQPPISVAQVDALVTSTRSVHDELRHEEARAWVMRDLLDLGAAHELLQRAEINDQSVARGWPGLEPAHSLILAAAARRDMAENRRRAIGALWRFRVLFGPLPVSVNASPASAPLTASSAPAASFSASSVAAQPRRH